MSRRRGERGSALLWAGLVLALMVGLGTLLVATGALTARGRAAQGAADLAALAGARAALGARDACADAAASARLNAVEVVACSVTGDEVEIVVTVDVRAEVGVGPWRATVEGHANAGVLTGAPA